jgi:glutathione reductase (NADPH)
VTGRPADVDLFVIGAGSGGVRAARIAAGHGAKVMIAEEYRVGGTCVIRGCVPKKLLVYASRFAHEFHDAPGFGWTIPRSYGDENAERGQATPDRAPAFDWPTLIANKNKEIARLEGAYRATLDKAGVEILDTRAVIEDAHTVRLASGARVRSAQILIATGASPHLGHDVPGIAHAITSNDAFDLPALPDSIVIQGGGYIAVEFACIFAGLGSDVTLVYRGENILRGFDDDVRTHLRGEMEGRGINVITGETVTAIERDRARSTAWLSGGRRIEVDRVMLATGRWPNIAGLGLETAGIAIAPNGGIAVDAYSQTSVPSVHAIGDVTNRVNLTPVAIRDGHAFADTVFGSRPTRVDHVNVPSAVFSEPEIGAVGLTEHAALQRLPRVDIYKSVFRPLKATLSGRATRVLMKLVVDGATDRVVGCHIVGEGAAEMIQLLGIAVKAGATKADFDATVAVHPTAAEEIVTMRTPSARHGLKAAE